jgi:DNA-directed RNA polymerase subunit beta'
VGGTASNIATQSKIEAKYDGIVEIEELRSVPFVNHDGKPCEVVVGRSAEMRLVHPKTNIILTSAHLPYGAHLYHKSGDEITKGTNIADWDPFNAVIVTDISGTVKYHNLIENVTYRVEKEEQTGYHDKVIIESRLKAKKPTILMFDEKGIELKEFDLPVGSHIVVDDGRELKAGEILVKIPRAIGKTGDITGGLPRVTALVEARNPSDPAKVAEIDGVVSFAKKLKRGNREVTITSKTGESKTYLVPTTKQILAQENDYVRAGTPLSDGDMTPSDILAIKGPMRVQEYIVNEIQEVYRLQGVKINDKHFEVIVRQMMRKVEIDEPGDTRFLEGELIERNDFIDENDNIFGKVVVVEPGDSLTLKAGQIITARKLRDENSQLKRRDNRLIEARDAQPATGHQILQGITRSSLQTKSFISAASFQETTKVLTNAAISARTDYLTGLKENVIIGGKIPAGTGMRDYEHLIVGSMDDYEALVASETEKILE